MVNKCVREKSKEDLQQQLREFHKHLQPAGGCQFMNNIIKQAIGKATLPCQHPKAHKECQ